MNSQQFEGILRHIVSIGGSLNAAQDFNHSDNVSAIISLIVAIAAAVLSYMSKVEPVIPAAPDVPARPASPVAPVVAALILCIAIGALSVGCDVPINSNSKTIQVSASSNSTVLVQDGQGNVQQFYTNATATASASLGVVEVWSKDGSLLATYPDAQLTAEGGAQ